MPDTLYIALCLLAPLAWGVLSARLYEWFEARRAAAAAKADGPDHRPAAKTAVESADLYEI